MSLTETTYLVVGASFALYIFIAIRSRAGSTQEFYVAGKGIHPVANGMATAADWMSAASFTWKQPMITNPNPDSIPNQYVGVVNYKNISVTLLRHISRSSLGQFRRFLDLFEKTLS